MQRRFIAGLDVGTTTVRCQIYDFNFNTKGKAQDKIKLLYPEPGFVEIDPNELFIVIKSVVNQAFEDAGITAKDLNCMGITTQRSTFITWEKGSGKHFHNFITWQDLRANSLVEKWNSNFYLKCFRAVSGVMYFLTKNPKFLTGKVLKFLNPSVIVRLAWMIRTNAELSKAMETGNAMCGTLESWLLYKFRQGSDSSKYVEHISDYSNVTSTTYFDPFDLKYAGWLLNMVKIKENMLPQPVINSHDFGYIDSSIFGTEIKIASCIADQPASMYGQCCFNPGDIKVTLGTGAFLNINCGSKCHASNYGLYPLVAWQMGNEIAYTIEGASNDMGVVIEWAQRVGIIENIKLSASVAESVQTSEGVYFVPALAGLGPPINNVKAGSGFIGVKPSTTQPHMVRAVLEGLTFRVALLVQCVRDETNFKVNAIKVDGGVSANDFICQTLANVTGLIIERAESPDMTVLGAVYMAGVNQEIWTRDDLLKNVKIQKTFVPDYSQRDQVLRDFKRWKKATKHFSNWY